MRNFTFEESEWIRQWIMRASKARDKQRRRVGAMLITVLQGTGARSSEVRRLTIEDLHGTTLIVPEQIAKNQAQRTIPLWRPTKTELDEHIEVLGLSGSDPLFPNARGQAMSFSGRERWRDDVSIPARHWVAAHLGERDATGRIASARAYDLTRHRYARAQLAAFMSVAELAEIMGHSVQMLSSAYAGTLSEPQQSVAANRHPYDPEAELTAARDKVAAEIAQLSDEELLRGPGLKPAQEPGAD